ncbi:MAG: hypothetical protein K2W96_08240 [Gemmataceae bacterium]|nr:hypothetical protein [Gemmataceae bacterium]
MTHSFWAARNAAILDQFSRLPPSRSRVVKLEELDFARYREIAEWLGGNRP